MNIIFGINWIKLQENQVQSACERMQNIELQAGRTACMKLRE